MTPYATWARSESPNGTFWNVPSALSHGHVHAYQNRSRQFSSPIRVKKGMVAAHETHPQVLRTRSCQRLVPAIHNRGPFPVAEHPTCRRVESLGSEMRSLRRQRMGMRTPSRPGLLRCSAREPTPAIAARDRARCVIHIPRRSPAGYLAAGCASS